MTFEVIVDISEDLPPGGQLVVTSEDDSELFVDAFRRAFRAQFGRTFEEAAGSPATEEEVHLLFVSATMQTPVSTGAALTVGHMRQFLGNETGSLRLAWGVGGDYLPVIVTIWTLVQLGFEYREVLGLLDTAQDKMNARIYQRQRRLFEDWRDADLLPMELEQEVREFRTWNAREFERRFGVGLDAGSGLLKTLGYSPDRDAEGGRIWTDTTE